MIIRSILFLCVFLFAQVKFVGFIHDQCKTLSMFGNLPHRSLGGLYWCHLLQPQREDYAYDYCVEWFISDYQERLLEGQIRPVVPMSAVTLSRSYDYDEDMVKLRDVFMHETLNGKSRFHYQPKPKNEIQPESD